MLRESSKIAGNEVQLSDITKGLSERTQIPQGDLLVNLAEAIVARDPDLISDARNIFLEVLGNDALVDAVAVASAFHGFVRIADAIGIPYTGAAGGIEASELREETGINAFHRIKELA